MRIILLIMLISLGKTSYAADTIEQSLAKTAINERLSTIMGVSADYLSNRNSIQTVLAEITKEGWTITLRDQNGEETADWNRARSFKMSRTYTVSITRSDEHQALIEKEGHPKGQSTYQRTYTQGISGVVGGPYKVSDTDAVSFDEILPYVGGAIVKAHEKGARQ